MRKFIDTIVLIVLLLGPALVLTCVSQDSTHPTEQLASHGKELGNSANVTTKIP